MAEPTNDFERRVADAGGWPRPPRWMMSAWWLALLAGASLGNGWAAAARWTSGERFGVLLALGIFVSTGVGFLNGLRLRRRVRRAPSAR